MPQKVAPELVFFAFLTVLILAEAASRVSTARTPPNARANSDA